MDDEGKIQILITLDIKPVKESTDLYSSLKIV